MPVAPSLHGVFVWLFTPFVSLVPPSPPPPPPPPGKYTLGYKTTLKTLRSGKVRRLRCVQGSRVEHAFVWLLRLACRAWVEGPALCVSVRPRQYLCSAVRLHAANVRCAAGLPPCWHRLSCVPPLLSPQAKLVIISNNCPSVRKSEIEYYAMLSKVRCA